MKKQLQYLKGKNVWEIQVLCLDEEKETIDRKSTRQNSSHGVQSRMPSSA